MKMFDFVYLRIRHVHMIDISLTPEQKVALEAMHTKARDGRERDRIKEVLLLFSEGCPSLKQHKH